MAPLAVDFRRKNARSTTIGTALSGQPKAAKGLGLLHNRCNTYKDASSETFCHFADPPFLTIPQLP